MAGSLIETLAGDFDPAQYKDSYREALEQVIQAKVAGHELVAPVDAQPTSGTVVDLMAALRASVAAAKKGLPGAGSGARAGDAEPAAKPRKRAPRAGAAAAGQASATPAAEPGKRPAKRAAKARKSA